MPLAKASRSCKSISRLPQGGATNVRQEWLRTPYIHEGCFRHEVLELTHIKMPPSNCRDARRLHSVRQRHIMSEQAFLKVQDNSLLKRHTLRSSRLREDETGRILDRALDGSIPTKQEALQLLRCRSIEDAFSLFTTASKVRETHFREQVEEWSNIDG